MDSAKRKNSSQEGEIRKEIARDHRGTPATKGFSVATGATGAESPNTRESYVAKAAKKPRDLLTKVSDSQKKPSR